MWPRSRRVERFELLCRLGIECILPRRLQTFEAMNEGPI